MKQYVKSQSNLDSLEIQISDIEGKIAELQAELKTLKRQRSRARLQSQDISSKYRSIISTIEQKGENL